MSKPRKAASVTATTKTTTTRRSIAEAVQQYMAENYGSLIALSALASGPEIEAMFAEIDRNLAASEQSTARLLAAQD